MTYDTLFIYSPELLIRPLQNVLAVAASVKSEYFKHETDSISQWRTLRQFIYPENFDFPHNDLGILVRYNNATRDLLHLAYVH